MRLLRVLRLKARIMLRLLRLRIKYPPAYRFAKNYWFQGRRMTRAIKKGMFPATAADATLDKIGETWGVHREMGESDRHYKARILEKYDMVEAPRGR